MKITKDTKVYDIVKHYKTKSFNDKYNYSGGLGVVYNQYRTIFKVWSPISTDIKLRIYQTGTPQCLGGSDEYVEYEMSKNQKVFGLFKLMGI